jgi:hypothetical protein
MHDLTSNISHIPYQGVAAVYKSKIGFLDSILEAEFPKILLFETSILNSEAACQKFLNLDLRSLTPEHLARRLAVVSYQRAKEYGHITQLFGLALVEGDGYIYLALQTSDTTISKAIKPKKLDPPEKNKLISQFVFKTMLQQLTSAKPLSNQVVDYQFNSNTSLSQKIVPLFENKEKIVYPYKTSGSPKAIFAGSWKPLTREHMYMTAIAEVFCDTTVYFEVSIQPIKGPPLDFIETENLIKQFDEMHLAITKAPTFLEKAKLFPGATFVVGMDTWLEIISPKYYDFPVNELIRQFKQLQVDFLVFGRQQNGSFITLADNLSFGIARKVPQHVFSENPENDYQSEGEMREALQKEKYQSPSYKRKSVVGL